MNRRFTRSKFTIDFNSELSILLLRFFFLELGEEGEIMHTMSTRRYYEGRVSGDRCLRRAGCRETGEAYRRNRTLAGQKPQRSI